MSEPKPGQTWRSVTGAEVVVRRVWTSRGETRHTLVPEHVAGDRLVEVKGKRKGRSGPSLAYYTVADFVANWATVKTSGG